MSDTLEKQQESTLPPRILMCPPDHFGIEYEINPWMRRTRQSDPATARLQWQQLHDVLVNLGVRIELMTPEPGLPDLVFTANAGLIFGSDIYLSQFRHGARQGETPVDEAWFQKHGFNTHTLPAQWSFEGAGDALFCGDTLFGGYIIRSEAAAMQWIGQQLKCRVIPLQLVDDHYYHLDTCFCPLASDLALWYPAAFDEYARTAVREHIPRLIEVSAQEATRFACNAVVVGNQVVLNTGCPELEKSLARHGFTAISTPLDEFIKAGGSAKCLTLRLDGEDAAAWRIAEIAQ